MSKNIVTESDLGPETRLPPVQLVEHLLGSLQEDQKVDAFDLESAINAFTNFQEPMSNSKISELTISGSIIVQFLVASKETIGDYEQWTIMSPPMKVRLVDLLNKILNQGFIRSLFSLRDHIRTLALGSKPRHSASAMATLPDVLIASVIDYINGDISNNLPQSAALQTCPSWSHQTIELVVRIPTDQEQLMDVLFSSIPRNDKLSYEIKLACLSLLYCLCCLDNWSPFQPDQACDQLASFITSLDENISVSQISVSQILCLYGVSFKSINTSPFLRHYLADSSDLSVFAPQNLLGDIKLNTAQNTLFSDGGEMMPWVWLHADFCPDVETKLKKSEVHPVLSSAGNPKNFFFGLSPPEGLSPSTWNRIWRSIFSILLDIHERTRNQDKFENSTVDGRGRLSRLVVEALQRLFENVFDLPEKRYFIRQVIGLPSKDITFFLQKAQKNLHKFLNQTLSVVQQSMESIKTEDTNYMSEATDCLDFLNFWAENQFGKPTDLSLTMFLHVHQADA
ncbi:uncharacterized protein MELLADRAFT_58872 [Melampsora larici-populina 98AG31]|uniref:Uncharacterized protein n=1 Tax=Melampsora larici-populina (strain 98AG31 / pathotype 3-4-7) TaxID=747676 RepID=F4R688_MELLP|nr:uncharacterized protein MELLADRAFT_58872 [Melampsora larici-populina 98AG31]EGG12509.1 hypothetical protein MELLADRAFT_58872 [Melampsora larici-populina 98AG31]